MGIWEQMDEGFLNRLGAEFKFEPPRRKGYGTVEAIRAMDAGKVKAFISLGGNFLSATPDTDVVAGGLGKCNLTAFIATKLNRNHLVSRRVIFMNRDDIAQAGLKDRQLVNRPATSRASVERFGTST